MLYGFMKSVLLHKDHIQAFMRFLVMFSIIACIYGLIFDRNEVLSIRYVSNTNLVNVRSFFANRNQFASFLLLAVIANLYLCMDKQDKRVNCLALALQVGCIMLTFSRGALFSVVIVFGLMIIQSKGYTNKIFVLFIGLFLLLVILLNSSLWIIGYIIMLEWLVLTVAECVYGNMLGILLKIIS